MTNNTLRIKLNNFFKNLFYRLKKNITILFSTLRSSYAHSIPFEVAHVAMPCTLRASQVRFAKLNKMTDNRANIGGTIIGIPIVGQ